MNIKEFKQFLDIVGKLSSVACSIWGSWVVLNLIHASNYLYWLLIGSVALPFIFGLLIGLLKD